MYIVGKATKANPHAIAMSSAPYVHLTSASARTEARRLAAEFPDRIFYVFKAISKSEAIPVEAPVDTVDLGEAAPATTVFV